MSTPSGVSGPTYWLQHYGFTSQSEFSAQAEQFIPPYPPFGYPGVNSLWLAAAYNYPYTVAGLVVQAGLALEGYTGVAATSGQTLQAQLNQAAVNSEGGSMAQLVIANCFQVSIEAATGGRQVVNVIGVVNAGGTAAAAATAVKTAWEIASGPLARLSSLVVMTNYHAVDISSTSGAIADLASTTAGGVTASQALATRGACALVKWNGSTRNRSSRGRLYYGPIMELDIQSDGATLDTTRSALMATAFTNFRNSLASSGYPLAVLSRTLSTEYPVTAHAIEATIATQRRRIRS